MAEEERRRTDLELLKAVNSLTEQLEDDREKREKSYAVAIALQEHKTIERVDSMWETLAQWRAIATSARVTSSRLTRFGAWGCATLIAVVGLLAVTGVCDFQAALGVK